MSLRPCKSTSTVFLAPRRCTSAWEPKSDASCGSEDATTEDAHPRNQSRDAWLNSVVYTMTEIFVLVSRSAPFLPRLHPNTASGAIYHVHQPPGVTASLGPGMVRWLFQCTVRRLATRLAGHLLLNVDNRAWTRTCVLLLTCLNCANALENNPCFYGGFGALLTHVATYDSKCTFKWSKGINTANSPSLQLIWVIRSLLLCQRVPLTHL